MQTIDAKTLQQKTTNDDQLLVINTLDEENFDQTHIPGSQNIPLSSDSFVGDVESAAGSKDREIVVYCASDSCPSSTKAAQKLEEAGFTNVKDFEGGAKVACC